MPDEKPTTATAQPRYAVYDETHQRFLGGVHATKTAAEEARKSGPESHTLKVREV